VVEVAIADGARLPNRNNTVIEWNMVVGEGMQCLKNTICMGGTGARVVVGQGVVDDPMM